MPPTAAALSILASLSTPRAETQPCAETLVRICKRVLFQQYKSDSISTQECLLDWGRRINQRPGLFWSPKCMLYLCVERGSCCVEYTYKLGASLARFASVTYFKIAPLQFQTSLQYGRSRKLTCSVSLVTQIRHHR
jgi:hypothetical protein